MFEFIKGDFCSVNEVLFIGNNCSYTLFDFQKRTAIIYKYLQEKISEIGNSDFSKEVLLATDDTYFFSASLIACWLLNLKVLQPNSLKNELISSSLANKIVLATDKSIFENIDNQSNLIALSFVDELSYSEADISLTLVSLLNKTQEYIEQGDICYKSLELIQQTSGSTGIPKFISRSYYSFRQEISNLINDVDYFNNINNKDIKDKKDICAIATVPLFHAYGIVFRFFIPLSLGMVSYIDMLEYQEQFYNLKDKKIEFFAISSPGFFKRLDDNKANLNIGLVLSAGGRLAPNVLSMARNFFNSKILEIYGSTETGVIGYRYPVDTTEYWKPLRDNKVYIEKQDFIEEHIGIMTFLSPYINNGCTYKGEDIVELKNNDFFALLGRSGRLIKIEDNRISIDEIENVLKGFDLISDCAVVSYRRKEREYIGAAIVLSKIAYELIKQKNMSRGQFVIYMRQLLMKKILPLAIPRNFMIYEHLPERPNGKIDYVKIKDKFNEIS
ncbi:MAG: AMP-binding protein [Succinivibrionaceae bacterium]